MTHVNGLILSLWCFFSGGVELLGQWREEERGGEERKKEREEKKEGRKDK